MLLYVCWLLPALIVLALINCSPSLRTHFALCLGRHIRSCGAHGQGSPSPSLVSSFRCLGFVRGTNPKSQRSILGMLLRQGLQGVLHAAPSEQHKFLSFWPRACRSTQPCRCFLCLFYRGCMGTSTAPHRDIHSSINAAPTGVWGIPSRLQGPG